MSDPKNVYVNRKEIKLENEKMSLKIWVNIEIGKYNGQNLDQSYTSSDNRINDLLGNITESQADRLDVSGISGNNSFLEKAGDMTNVTMF